MKAIAITSIFFLMLLAGIRSEVVAQASATVNFTIVVTEDMLAGVDNVEPRGFGFDFENRSASNGPDAATSVSVSLQSVTDNINVNEVTNFETGMSAVDSPAFSEVLQSQMADNSISLTEENATKKDGQYIVVMEYN